MKAVLILLVLLYLAKEALLDDAEAIPTPGGEGSRHSEGEYKVLLSKGTDRLFSSTTQTFSMVREKKKREKKEESGPRDKAHISSCSFQFQIPFHPQERVTEYFL